MTEKTIELVEEYGEACYEHGRLGVTYPGEDAYDKACDLMAEIHLRIEAMERDAARYRWLEDYGTQAIETMAADNPAASFGELVDAAMAEG